MAWPGRRVLAGRPTSCPSVCRRCQVYSKALRSYSQPPPSCHLLSPAWTCCRQSQCATLALQLQCRTALQWPWRISWSDLRHHRIAAAMQKIKWVADHAYIQRTTVAAATRRQKTVTLHAYSHNPRRSSTEATADARQAVGWRCALGCAWPALRRRGRSTSSAGVAGQRDGHGAPVAERG